MGTEKLTAVADRGYFENERASRVTRQEYSIRSENRNIKRIG
jgi:hypothetical protein